MMKLTCEALLVSGMCLLSAVGFQCSQNFVSDGGGIEGEGISAAKVTYSDGTPAAKVRVRLVEAGEWVDKCLADLSVVRDSTLTDDSGRFSFVIPDSVSVNLEIQGVDEALFVPGFQDSTPAPQYQELQLTASTSIEGTISAAAGSATRARLSGLSISTPVDATGSFRFVNVPAGSYSVIAEFAGPFADGIALAGGVETKPAETVTGLSFAASPTVVIVDDFTNGFGTTLLGQLTRGKWWRYSDAYANPPGNSSLLIEVREGAEAWSGKSLHSEAVLGDSLSYPYAGFGCTLSYKGVADLTSLQKLTFMARGKGSLHVTFLSEWVSSQFAKGSQYRKDFTLDSVWTLVEIPVDSLTVPTSSEIYKAGIRWSDAAPTANHIQFAIAPETSTRGEKVEFWLDDIVLHGVTLEDVVGD